MDLTKYSGKAVTALAITSWVMNRIGNWLDLVEISNLPIISHPAFAPSFFAVGLLLLVWAERDPKPDLRGPRGESLSTASRVSKDALKSALAGLLLGGLFIGMWYVWRKPAARIAKSEEVVLVGAAISKAWGTTGTNDAYLVLDTSDLYQYRESYKLLLVCRAEDPTVDGLTDARIDKSRLFSIGQERTRLQLTLSQRTMNGFTPNGWLQFFSIMVPSDFDVAKAPTVQSVVDSGGQIVANPKALVHGTRR